LSTSFSLLTSLLFSYIPYSRMMEDIQQPMPTPDRDLDSLFIPERGTTPQQCDGSTSVAELSTAQQVPIVVQVLTPSSPTLVLEDAEAPEEEAVSPFVQELRDLEETAKAEIAAWDPIYLGQLVEEATGSFVAGTKRKGTSLKWSRLHIADLTAASEMNTDSSDDENEVDDDDDGEHEVPPLDPNSQTRPKLPIYHPGFKLTEDLSLGSLHIFGKFIKQARKDGYHDEETQYLWNEIARSKKIPYQDAVKLAVAGDTGAGKSALLNAVLGVINLTIEVRKDLDRSKRN
jgi:hypothetical protein